MNIDRIIFKETTAEKPQKYEREVLFFWGEPGLLQKTGGGDDLPENSLIGEPCGVKHTTTIIVLLYFIDTLREL